MATETNLRPAELKATALGVISDMDLTESKTDEGKDIISGSVTVKTSDVNFIKYKAYASKFTKAGKENSVYKGLQTCKNEFKTIATNGEEEATTVYVSGEVQGFTGERGDGMVFRSNFFNRPKHPITPEDYKAEFTIEGYIKSKVPEMDSDGNETGRLIVNLWCPTSNGTETTVEPISLVAPVEDGIAQAVDETFEIGQTAKFFGQIVNNRIEKIREIPVAIGKPRIEKTYEGKLDMVINGASMPYEEEASETNPAAYKADVIALAVTEREAKLNERKNKQASGQTNGAKPSGAAHGGRSLGF